MQGVSGSSTLLYIVVAGIAVVILAVLFRLLGGRGRTTEEDRPAVAEEATPADAAASEEAAGSGEEDAARSRSGPKAAEQVDGTGPPADEDATPETAAEEPEPTEEAGPVSEPGPAEEACLPAWTMDDYLAALGQRKHGLQKALAALMARRETEGRSLLEIELRAVTGSLVCGEQGFAVISASCHRWADSLEKAAADSDSPGLSSVLGLLRGVNIEAAEQALVDLAGSETPLAAQAHHLAGRLAEERADFAVALQRYEAAIGLEGDNPRFLQAAASLAREVGRFDEARQWLERFFQCADESAAPETYALAQHDLGVIHAREGQYGEAVELYRQALATLGEDHPQRGLLLHSMAETREKMGQYEEAGKLYIQAVRINAARLGKHHPAVGTTLYKLAGLYEELEEDTKAEPLYRQSLAISRGIFGDDHPEIGTIMNNLAEVYRLQERYDEAEPLYRQSLAIAEKNLGPEHLNVAVTLNNLAELCSATGRPEEAAELQERAFVIFQQGSPMEDLMEIEKDEVDVEELKGQTVAG